MQVKFLPENLYIIQTSVIFVLILINVKIRMDRVQFYNMLKEARVLSGVSWIDLCYRMQRTQAAVMKLLSEKSDSSMDKIFDFIEAINAEILIEAIGHNLSDDYIFCHEPDLHLWLTNKCREYPEKQICEIIHTSTMTVRNLKSGKRHYKVSYFIDILNYFQLTCQVLPLNSPILR